MSLSTLRGAGLSGDDDDNDDEQMNGSESEARPLPSNNPVLSQILDSLQTSLMTGQAELRAQQTSIIHNTKTQLTDSFKTYQAALTLLKSVERL